MRGIRLFFLHELDLAKIPPVAGRDDTQDDEPNVRRAAVRRLDRAELQLI
jgi:hypothetical protein